MVLALGVLLGPSIASADRVSRQAVITSSSGQVEWLKSGSDTWQAAGVDQQLASGDKVRTGEGGQVVLTYDDGSTTELSANTEFAVQTLTKDSANEQLESIVAILEGRVRAQVTPLKEGSKFEIETPVMVAAVRGTTLGVGVDTSTGTPGVINVEVTNEDGSVDLYREEGENPFTIKTESGDEVLVEYDPQTGVIKITSIKGTFEVIGPDKVTRILNEGDTVIFKGGAATFIPAGAPLGDAPIADTFVEPTSGG